MARALLAALAAGGATTEVASRFQSRDGQGDPDRQKQLVQEAQGEIARLVARGERAKWRVWLTYHNYYKAPDLLGPAVAAALEIPYAIVEASRATKRLNGPWAAFAQVSEAACDAACTIFHVTAHDAEALHRDAPKSQRLIQLRPFLPVAELPPESAGTGPMLSVGMMRAGAKAASYAIIAETLHHLDALDWRLDVIGDGPARPEVERLMAPFGARVRLLGALSEPELAAHYGRASLLFWPGVNEAFGMVYLEAQAAGVPVVAQDRPGLRDVLAPGLYPPIEAGSAALAERIRDLLLDPAHRAARSKEARSHMGAGHLIGTAAQTLCGAIAEMTR